jgi:hypothetical protein
MHGVFQEIRETIAENAVILRANSCRSLQPEDRYPGSRSSAKTGVPGDTFKIPLMDIAIEGECQDPVRTGDSDRLNGALWGVPAMFRVIRCGGCRTFTYVDRFQEWKLCPICSETIDLRRAVTYLEVEDYRIAERVVAQLEQYLHDTKRTDLTPEERKELREQYAAWLRNKA